MSIASSASSVEASTSVEQQPRLQELGSAGEPLQPPSCPDCRLVLPAVPEG